MPTLTQIIADTYRKMVNPPQAVARPKWVPASITEESVPAFVRAVTEARKANESIVEFNGKKYGITVNEDANEEDQGKGKKIQDMDAEKAPKQASDEVPAEVKEEDSEEIQAKVDGEAQDKGDKRAEMAEELVGNQHKLDVNHNGKIDADDLKKLRGEEKEEGSEEHPEPDADNMGGPSDHDADNKGEDNKEEDDVEEARDWSGHEPIDWTDHGTLRHDVKSKLHGVTYKAGTTRADWRADHPTNPKHHAAAIARVKAGGGSYRGGDAGYVEDDVEKNGKEVNEVLTKKNTAADFIHDFVHSKNPKFAGKSVKQRQKMALGAYYAKQNESTNLTGEQTISSVASTYTAMVNEEDEYAGDNPVDKLHFDVPAFIRVLEKAREDFKTDEDIHNFTQQLLAMKSDCIHTDDLPASPMKEGTSADAEAGPEVMDPVTQKAKDDADDETEVKDGTPVASQDGTEKVTPADKPAPANSSAALPKVAVITDPVTTNESVSEKQEVDEKYTAIVSRKRSDGSYSEVGMNDRTIIRGSHSNILKKAKEYAKGPHRVELFHGDRVKGEPHKVIHSEPKVAVITAPVTTNESTEALDEGTLEEQQDGTFYDGSNMLGEAQARYSDSYQFTHKPGDAESEKKLADLKAKTKGTGNRVVLQGRLGKNNPNAHKYSVKPGGGKSGGPVGRPAGQSGPHSHQRIAKADAAHHDVYVYRKA